MKNNKILVIGSSNIDMTVKVDHLPLPGETVGNGTFEQAFGGKGANQTVAAARLNGNVEFITCLGNDVYADVLEKHFGKNNIQVSRILRSETKPTGVALIYISGDAENCIAVAPGANYELTKSDTPDIIKALDEASLLVLQAEIPYQTNKELIHKAYQKNIRVMFNPAPACKIDKETLVYIEYLIVNEGELQEVSGLKIEDKGLEYIVDVLLQEGVQNVIVTLGKQGVYFKNNKQQIRVNSFAVEALDTTGAGDTFCGALASRVAGNQEVTEEILKYCCAASAISVTRRGAQTSIPYHEEVVKFLENE